MNPETIATERMTKTEAHPAVSVIIIFLNPGASYLGEAIDSVRMQTLADWELILVDDGSTDDSGACARAAAAAAPERVRFLQHPNQENRGMSASRNLGIRAARGRYVAFLDADDVYLPERLAHHVAILDSRPEVAMVYGPYLCWHSWQDGAASPDRISELGLPSAIVHSPPAILDAFIRSGGAILPGICSLTARRDAVLGVGAFETSFRGCYEDQVFLAKMTGRYSVYITERCLDRYRQHPASCSAQAALSGEYSEYLPHPARERFLRWLEDYLATHGPSDPSLHQSLQRELWAYEHPRLHAVLIKPWLVARFWAKRQKRRMLEHLRLPGTDRVEQRQG